MGKMIDLLYMEECIQVCGTEQAKSDADQIFFKDI